MKPPYNKQTNNKDRQQGMNNQLALANERIRSPQVRLIGSDGENLGVVNTRDALSQARREGLDLVAINQQTEPMVVKVLDLGKYLYDLKREQKERAKKSRESVILLKEIQLRPVTDTHDIEIKARNARGFLDEGDKVKLVIKFRGREMSHRELGFEVARSFLAAVGAHKMEKDLTMQGNSITAILMPAPPAPLVKEAPPSNE